MSVMNGPFMSHTPAVVARVDEEAGQPVVGQRRCGEFHLLAVEDAGQLGRGVALREFRGTPAGVPRSGTTARAGWRLIAATRCRPP